MSTFARPSSPARDEGGAPRAGGDGWDPAFATRSPVFRPLAGAAALFAEEASFPSPDVIDRLLSGRAGIRFEEAPPRPRRRPRRERRGEGAPREASSLYDARITRDGVVPTRRGSWHDLLNALVWATFPRAKRALHARQHALVVPARPGESQRRPRALDALALLDEGGVVLVAGRPVAEAVVFGHAIYEGFVRGWPTPTASALVLAGEEAPAGAPPSLAALDERLASAVSDVTGLDHPSKLARLELAPLLA